MNKVEVCKRCELKGSTTPLTFHTPDKATTAHLCDTCLDMARVLYTQLITKRYHMVPASPSGRKLSDEQRKSV